MAEDSDCFVATDRSGNMRRSTVKFNVGSDYRLLQTIGTGAYGIVSSAISISTGQKVAIKKISNPFEILTTAKRTLRELKLLLHFKHDNIVGVKNILHRDSPDSKVQDVYVVMDLMESDLHHVIRSHQSLTENHICYFIYQLLRGLKYIHSANVIHRDLKPSNLLVNENCELKIGDFGMARGVANSPEDNRNFMTEYVATRWYRAPELMLSMSEYSMAIDMWSVGCIFAEMIARKQLFPGRNYIHQLQLIISVLGSPSTKLVASIRSERVRSYVQGLPSKKAVPFKTLFPKASDMVIDLLSRFLQFDPSYRESAEDAMKHKFFQEYHDQDDEPNCLRPFDFRFETAGPKGTGPTKDSVKEQVINLIHEYHTKRTRIKKQLVFVPKDVSTSGEPQSSSSSENITTSDQDANNNDTVDHDGFKKPSFIPISKVNKTKKSDVVIVAAEPMSAKSETSECEENKLPVSSDVAMLSAKMNATAESIPEAKETAESKNEGTAQKLSSKNQVKSTGSTVKKTISETTKMLVRDTILASMLAKKNGLTKPVEKPKKPITAAERQREREEKRRKRQEKAAEKERKKKAEEGSKPKLSEDDRNLLERWSKMQQQAKSTTGGQNQPSQFKNVSKENVQLDAMMSPNALSRQNSLPSLIAIRPRTSSHPEPITPRRWSLNCDVSNAYDASDQKVPQYVPTLSDIPPSPMVAANEDSANNNLPERPGPPSFLITHCATNNIATENTHFAAHNAVAIEQPTESVVQNFQTNEIAQLNQGHAANISVPQGDVHFGHVDQPSPFKQELRATENGGLLIKQPTERPSTLQVSNYQSQPAPVQVSTPSNSLISSSKSLVNLSPDTVDFVLNQQLQNATQQIIDTKHISEVESRVEPTPTNPETVLTLSPGKTSLIVKPCHTNIFNAVQKSASIEFSPASFLQELEKCNDRREQYLHEVSSDQNRNDAKFFNADNGSVMLSESAISNRNELLYVNSDLTHNPLKQPGYVPSQTDSSVVNGRMVGGYGIGYEPDNETSGQGCHSIANVTAAEGDNDLQYEMDCDSAKSSSSLLIDWLEASQMETHDIEQLQRELELGSPMCIDDYNFKPD